MRVTQSSSHLPSVDRGRPITLQIDGRRVKAYEGETIIGVIFSEGQRIVRHTAKKGHPRSMFCGIGVCYDCLVTVNGESNVRACQTIVEEDMVVETRAGGDND